MAGTLSQRDIKMIFSAETTKATRNVSDLSKAQKELRSNLNDLVEAASKGDISLDKLADSVRDLKAAQDELGTARSLVTQLNSQEAGLAKVRDRAQQTAEKYQQLQQQVAAAEKPTKRLTNSLEAAGRAAAKAAEDEARITKEVAEFRSEIEAIVGPIDKFEDTFREIAVSSKEVARGLAIAGEAADDFKVKLAAANAEAAKASGDKAFITTGLDAGLLKSQVEYLAQFENRVELLAQAKRELAQQNAAFDQALKAQEAREGAQNVARLEAAFNDAAQAAQRLEQIEGFRKIAQDVRASVNDVGRFQPALNGSAQAAERLADAILEIVDPARAANLSVDGLEQSIATASAVLAGRGKRSLQEYNAALNELASANAALSRLGTDVDSFARLDADARKAAAAFDLAQKEALDLAAAFDPAGDNAMQMAQQLQDAEDEVERLGKEMKRTGEAADVMGQKLRRAGVNTNDLDGATKRLTNTAKQSRASMDAIAKKTGGKGVSPLGFSLQDTQNLSYQINDLITQVASGTPIMQAFAQQAGQIYQIPAIQNMIVQFAKFIPLVALAAAALGTVVAAMARVEERTKGLKQINAAIAESVGGIKYDPKGLQETVDQIERLGVSAADARGAVTALVRESVDPKFITDIATAAINIKNSTDALGKDVPEVTKKLVDAFSQGKDGVLELDNQFHFLTSSQRDQIEAAKDGALAADLQTMAFNALYEQAAEVSDQLSGDSVDSSRALQGAWNDLLGSIGDGGPWEALKGWLNDVKIGAAIVIRTISGLLKEYGPAVKQLGQFILSPIAAARDIASGKTANAFTSINKTPAQIFAEAQAGVANDLANDPTGRPRGTRGNPFQGTRYRGNKPSAGRKKGKSDAQKEAERIAKQIESLEEQLTNSLDQMNASVARAAMGSIEEQLANAKKAVDSQYAKLYRDLDELNKISKGRANINGLTVEQYRAQLDANKELLSNVAQLKVYEDGVNQLLQQRTQLLADIESKAQSGQLTATEAATAAAEVTSRLNPMIANLAIAGQSFAAGLKDAKLSPEVQKFIAIMQRNISAPDEKGPGSALGKFTAGQIGQEEQKLNAIIAERNNLITANNALVELGLKTQVDARADAAAAYQDTQPRIEAQIASMTTLLNKARELGVITPQVYDTWIAKLEAVGVQSQYVDERIIAMNNAVQGSFIQGFQNMFDTLAQGLAGLATGTKNVGEVLMDLGRAALQFAADFLKAMADVLVQMLAIQAVKALFGAGTGGIGGLFFHGGTGPGGVGDASSGRRQRSGLNIPTAALAAIPRYHNGTQGAGLAPNETLAVLEKGEAVLTEEQQRQEAKRLAAARGGAGGPGLKQVLAFGDEQIAAAMAGPAGEDVTVTHIRRNKTVIKEALGIN